MTVTLDLNPEIEQRLQTLASERGVSLAVCLQEIVSKQVRVGPTRVATKGKAPNLPIRYLGAVGSLSRRDIYDDVR